MNTTYVPHSNGNCYARVQWSAKVCFVHGGYNSVDIEQDKPENPNSVPFSFDKSNFTLPESIPGADPTAPCECGSSILYGYNSVAEGKFTITAYNPEDVNNNNTNTTSTSVSEFTFNKSDRYRAYGAASYGCTLPNGDIPVENPWSWVWQVTPQSMMMQNQKKSSGQKKLSDEYVLNARETDLSIVIGDARFDTGVSATGTIYGGYMYAKLPHEDMIDVRYARLRDNRGFIGSDIGAQSPVVNIEDITYTDKERMKETMTYVSNKESTKTIDTSSAMYRDDIIDGTKVSFPVVPDTTSSISSLYNNIPIMASSSKKNYLSTFNVTKHRWVEWKDDMGSATIPLTQVFTIENQKKLIVLNSTVNPEQVFRAVVPLYTTHRGFQLFSDFRAVSPQIQTKIYSKKTLDGACPVDTCATGTCNNGFCDNGVACLDIAKDTLSMKTAHGMIDVKPYATQHYPDAESVFPAVHQFFRKLLNIPGKMTCSVYTPEYAYSQKGMNAVEYAYVSPVDVDLEYLFQHPGDYIGAVKEYQKKSQNQKKSQVSGSSVFVDASSAEDDVNISHQQLQEIELDDINQPQQYEDIQFIPWPVEKPLTTEWTKEALFDHYDSMIPLPPTVPDDADIDMLKKVLPGCQRILERAQIIADGLNLLSKGHFGDIPEILQIPSVPSGFFIDIASRLEVPAYNAVDAITRQISVVNVRLQALERVQQAKEIILKQAEDIEKAKAERLRQQEEETERLTAELMEKQRLIDEEHDLREQKAREEYMEKQRQMTTRQKNERAGILYRRAMREMGDDINKYSYDDVVAMYEAIVLDEDNIMENKLDGWEDVLRKRQEWEKLLEEQKKYAEEMFARMQRQREQGEEVVENENELPAPEKDEL